MRQDGTAIPLSGVGTPEDTPSGIRRSIICNEGAKIQDRLGHSRMPVGLESLSCDQQIHPVVDQSITGASFPSHRKKRNNESMSCKESRKTKQKVTHQANSEASAARKAAEMDLGSGEALASEDLPGRGGNRRERRRRLWLEERSRLPDHLRLALFQATKVSVARMDVHDLRRTHPSWIGMSVDKDKDENSSHSMGPARVPALDPECNELVRNLVLNEGWTYIANEDRYDHLNQDASLLCLTLLSFSCAQAVVDKNNLVFVLKARTPKNGWDGIIDGTEKALEAFASSVNLEFAALHTHDRGSFPSFSFGNSHGGGQKVRVAGNLAS